MFSCRPRHPSSDKPDKVSGQQWFSAERSALHLKTNCHEMLLLPVTPQMTTAPESMSLALSFDFNVQQQECLLDTQLYLHACNQLSDDGGLFFSNCGPLPVSSSLPSLLPSAPSLPLSFPPQPPGGPDPLTAAKGSGTSLKLPQWVRAQPGHQAVSGAFWAKRAILVIAI